MIKKICTTLGGATPHSGPGLSSLVSEYLAPHVLAPHTPRHRSGSDLGIRFYNPPVPPPVMQTQKYF